MRADDLRGSISERYGLRSCEREECLSGANAYTELMMVLCSIARPQRALAILLRTIQPVEV